MRDKQACGCVHDGTHWTHLCSPHAAEDAAISVVWAEDYYRTARFDPERTRLAAPSTDAPDWLCP